MMVEVLGNVLGTAIQGQIVGGASSDCSAESDDVSASSNSSRINTTNISLEETVRAVEMLQSAFLSCCIESSVFLLL